MDKNKKSKPLFVIQCYEDRQQTLPLRKAEHKPSESNGTVTNGYPKPIREETDKPPPPPPMPATNGHQNGVHKDTVEIMQAKRASSEHINSNNRQNGTLMRTPTPDYNNKSVNVKSLKNEKGELDSIESFKLKNPSNVRPRPPSNYFVKAPNGTATMKKHGRPVSVTIGEYAGVGSRREPSKLEFLNGDSSAGSQAPEDLSITNRLQSELVMTLSRSNLRKKTEGLTDAGR